VYLAATLLAGITEGFVSQALGILLVLFVPVFSRCVARTRFGKNKKEIGIIMVTALVAVNLLNFHYLKTTLPAEGLVGQMAKIEGEVKDFAAGETKPIYVIKAKVETDNETHENVKMLLFLDKETRLERFERISCEVKFSKIKKNLLFDGSEYYKAKGIRLSARPLGEIITMQPRNSLSARMGLINEYIKHNIEETFTGYQGDLMKAIILGNKSELSRDCKNAFKRGGIYHILAVSGLHMSIVTQFIYLILSKLRCSRKISAGSAIAGAFLFVLVVGPSPSVVRCAAMTIIYFLGEIIGREADSLNSLGLGLIPLLICNPYSVFDIGLQLSFLSTLGIIAWGPRLAEQMEKWKWPKFFRESLSVSFAATGATLPIIACKFNEVSLVAPLTNLLLMPLIPWTLICTLLFAIVKPLLGSGFFYKCAVLIVGGLVTLFVDIVRIFASFPLSKLQWWQMALCCCCVAILWLLRHSKIQKLMHIENSKRTGLLVCWISLFLLVVGSLSFWWLQRCTSRIFILPGSGNVLINCEGKNLLIGANRTKGYLNQLNWALDQTNKSDLDIFICRESEFSADLIEKICENFDVDNILTEEKIRVVFEEKRDLPKVRQLKEMEKFVLGEKAFLKVADGIAAFECNGNLTVILEPDADLVGLSEVIREADNIVMSKKTKLPAAVLNSQKVIVYDLKLTSTSDLSSGDYEVYTPRSDKVLTLSLRDGKTAVK
jgi:competence protein ComEC